MTRLKPGPIPRSKTERFWEKVDLSGDCWLWKAGRTKEGYGQFNPRTSGTGNRKAYAHRWAYELLVGPIPEGLVLDHLCRNKLCVRPEHLEPVTPRENGLRSIHCPGCACRED